MEKSRPGGQPILPSTQNISVYGRFSGSIHGELARTCVNEDRTRINFGTRLTQPRSRVVPGCLLTPEQIAAHLKEHPAQNDNTTASPQPDNAIIPARLQPDAGEMETGSALSGATVSGAGSDL